MAKPYMVGRFFYGLTSMSIDENTSYCSSRPPPIANTYSAVIAY